MVAWGTIDSGRVACLATQLVVGRSFNPSNVTSQVAEAAGNAFAVVHAKGMLNGDISGDNFLVASTSQFLLLDFGFARYGSVRQIMREQKKLQLHLSRWSRWINKCRVLVRSVYTQQR